MQKAPAVWKAMFHCMSIGKNYYTACSIDFVNLWVPEIHHTEKAQLNMF